MATQTQTQTQETQVPNQGQTTYKRVKMPVGVYEYVRNRAKARGLSMWQYIIQSINFYEASLRNISVSDATKAQNNSYYYTKLVMAVTEFIHKANQENYDNVVRIINQVEKRKGVDLSTLRQLIEMYRQKHRKSLVRTIMQELIRINVELMSKNQ